MSDIAAQDLIIQGTSIIEQIDAQMLVAANQAFTGQNVEIDHYYNDFTPQNLEQLQNRAIRATQILFDFFKTSPVLDEERRMSHDRVQKETDTVGFYVVYASLRDDNGVQRRYNCYRAIDILRRRFSNFTLSLSLDDTGIPKPYSLRALDIERIRNLPLVAAYQVLWTITLNRDLKWQEPM